MSFARHTGAYDSLRSNKALQLTPRATPSWGLVPFWRRRSAASALAVSARGAAERPAR